LDLLDSRQHRAGLLAVRAGPHAEVHVGSREIEAVEKDARHGVIVVLTRMHEHFGVALAQQTTDRCGLDELRPRADYRDNLHRISTATWDSAATSTGNDTRSAVACAEERLGAVLCVAATSSVTTRCW